MSGRTVWWSLGVPLGVVTAGLTGWFTAPGTSGHSSKLTSLTVYVTVGVIVLVAIQLLVFAIRAYGSSRSRSEYRSRISGIVKSGVSSPEAIGQANPSELVVARYIVDRDAAERRLASYLPANPRRAKRLINHERLYRQIGENRGIFGGDPKLTYDHMARWSLIVEEWPRLGDALTRDPAIMKTLEEAEDTAGLQQALDAQVPGVKATDELYNVLCGDRRARLSPVLARIVRFEAAPAPPAGWYPDPRGLQALRWWDGTQWGLYTQPLPGMRQEPRPQYPATTTAASERYGRFWQQSAGRHHQ